MKKTWMIVGIVALLLSAIISALVLRPGVSEPSYEGKCLTEWVLVWLSTDADSPEGLQATQAVRAIGTNGIPFLTRCIAYESSPWKTRLRYTWNSTCGRMNTAWVWRDRLAEKKIFAGNAFTILREDAAPAVPALSKVLKSDRKQNSLIAALALGNIGQPALGVLLSALQSKRETEAVLASTGIAEMETNALPAIPILMNQLTDTRRSIALRAALTLGKLHLGPEVVVPALTNTYAKWGDDSRYFVLTALAEFRTNARAALPLVTAALVDTNTNIRDTATNALRQIAPEVLSDTAVP